MAGEASEATEPLPARVEAFLAGYEALCREHGVCVESCRCCDSPWLMDLHENEHLPTMDKPVTLPGDPERQLAQHIKHLREEAGLDNKETPAPT